MKNLKKLIGLLICAIFISHNLTAQVSVKGELKQWHKVTLQIEGPQASETGTSNPFLSYKLTGVFTSPSGKVYEVPGYFAADGDAANTSATSGNIWKVHLSPSETGTWNYTVRMRSGANVAVAGTIDAGSAVAGVDELNGTFDISASDKTGRDLRAKGRLEYVGEHHLKFAGNGEWFLKTGPDSPENLLDFVDFDNLGNNKTQYHKTWGPHLKDWNEGDPTWKDGKGKGLIGAVNYIASRGMNSISFLTMAGPDAGDDRNVYPWANEDDFTQYDCSKLDQWDIVFSHAQNKGLHLHFKTQETENEAVLDNGNLGNTRKLYYRELIARFGYHLALNWNLGEENGSPQGASQNDAQRIANLQYIDDIDPFNNNIVVHTAPDDHNKIYTPLLGDKSKMTGASVQIAYARTHELTTTWIKKSAEAGKKWVVACDEQGGANTGVPEDGYSGKQDKHDIRDKVLWGNIMAGGAGVEYYFGYNTMETDLECQDWRSREMSWRYCRNALDFFYQYVPFWEMKGDDSKTSTGYCLYKANEIYVVYLPNGGNPTVQLGTGTYSVKWYDPIKGGALIDGNTNITGGAKSIGSAPNASQDWVAIITESNFVHNPDFEYYLETKTQELSILQSIVELEKAGDSQPLTCEFYPVTTIDKTVSWSTQDAAIATVDASGKVTAVSLGETYIIATANDGSMVKDSVKVYVGITEKGKYGENFYVIEADKTRSDLGEWELIEPGNSKYFKGDGMGPMNNNFLYFNGNTLNGGSALSPLQYQFTCPKSGNYSVSIRFHQALEPGEENDKRNDVYIKMAGDFVSGTNKWTTDLLKNDAKLYGNAKNSWSSMYKIVAHDKHGEAIYNLKEGEKYTFTVSGRSQGVCMDYIIFYHVETGYINHVEYIKPDGKTGWNPIDVAVRNPDIYRPKGTADIPEIKCGTEVKAVDFDKFTDITGFTDAKTDTKAGKEILQIPARLQWAAAQFKYTGYNSEVYFKLNTMQESDGESSFRVKVNGELIKEVINTRIHGTEIPDYTIETHEINAEPFFLKRGDVIQVEFSNATNEMVEEIVNGETMWATSRGRWYSLQICSRYGNTDNTGGSSDPGTGGDGPGNITEGPGSQDAILYYGWVPTEFPPSGTFPLSIQHETVDMKEMDIHFDLKQVSPWQSIISIIGTVAGKGTSTFDCTLPSTLAEGANYQWIVYMTPKGAKWQETVEGTKQAINATVLDGAIVTGAPTNTAVEKTVADDIRIFPNPFTSTLSIDVKDNNYTWLNLIDSKGNILAQQNINGDSLIKLDFDDYSLPSGLYFVQLRGIKHISTFKVVRY